MLKTTASLIHSTQHSDTPLYMSLRLEQSKTDPFRRGTTVIISNTQAVKHMLAYLRARKCSLGRQPLFLGDDGQALSTSVLGQVHAVTDCPSQHS